MKSQFAFVLTLFVSAFLSFSVQPLLGKMMLPLIGGAPAGWIVTMAFFQFVLLLGYILSHLLQRLSPLRHGLFFLLVYLVGIAFTPPLISLSDLPDSQTDINWSILRMLSQVVFIPFVALTATTSALLRFFSATQHKTAKDPYYLFIASNTGSLLGLFIYPIMLEPFFDLDDLSTYWSNLYKIAIIGITICLIALKKNQFIPSVTFDQNPKRSIRPTWCIHWFLLAFIPCSLSMGVTTLITVDIGNMPLFWVLPLGLYLLSFIFGFKRKPLIQADHLSFFHTLSVAFFLILLLKGFFTSASGIESLLISLCVLLSIFFIICLSCHQTLYNQRPSTEHLTFYYLIIATGGAAAGVLNAFIAPLILNNNSEFLIILTLSLLIPAVWSKTFLPPSLNNKDRLFVFTVMLSTISMIFFRRFSALDEKSLFIPLSFFLLSMTIVIACFKPRFLFIIGLTVIFYYSHSSSKDITFQDRNFFGTTRVIESKINPQNEQTMRSMWSGKTIHGQAVYDKNKNPLLDIALTYYSKSSPSYSVYKLYKPHKVAIFGLGSGQMACYDKTARTTFFEIDPHVVKVAKNYFPYLTACPPDNVVIGDGRLAFSRETKEYDLLVLDTFSSDNIPTHILTVDALKSYRQHLSADAVILFHISNIYLDLAPYVAASAREVGLKAYLKQYDPDPKKEPFAKTSMWMAVPLGTGSKRLEQDGWSIVNPGQMRAWTDQRSSSLLAIHGVNSLFRD